jgi:predicted methyltransferase
MHRFASTFMLTTALLGLGLPVQAATRKSGAKPAATAPAPAQAPMLDAATAALLDASLTGAHRNEDAKSRDIYRHPKEALAFYGLKSTMTVIEVAAGGGWWTDVLAPVLKDGGKLVVAESIDVNSPFRRQLGATLVRYGAKPDIYGKVQLVSYNPAASVPLGEAASADMVLVLRHMHNLTARKQADKALKLYFDVLKPGGILAIEDHRWPEDKPYPTPVSGANGYLKTSEVVSLATAAGFKLAGSSEINANPKDTKDYPGGVWTLPPVLRNGETDRAKYLAIGESDRMTLKFVKP